MKYSIHDHTVFASVFLLAVSRRKKQRDTSNRSGWPLCFRESSKTTKSHSNLCCPFASALGFPFFSISSSVILPSLFHSFTFIRSFHRLYFFFVYLLCYKHHDILTPPCHLPLVLSLSLSPSRPLSVILLVRLSRSFALSLFSEGRQMGISQTAALFFPCFSCSSLH